MGTEHEVEIVAEHRKHGGEMLPMLAVSWRASQVKSGEAGRFHEVAGMSIVAAHGLSVFHGRHFNCRQPSGLK